MKLIIILLICLNCFSNQDSFSQSVKRDNPNVTLELKNKYCNEAKYFSC